MDTTTRVKPVTGRSPPPPPPLSSSLNAESLQQLFASITDDGDRDMANLLGDDNNQRLSSLSERLSGLGKFVIEVFVFALYPFTLSISYLVHSLTADSSDNSNVPTTSIAPYRAKSALRNSTKHNVPSEKTAPLPSQANKMCGSKLKKRTRPAGKTCWW